MTQGFGHKSATEGGPNLYISFVNGPWSVDPKQGDTPRSTHCKRMGIILTAKLLNLIILTSLHL